MKNKVSVIIPVHNAAKYLEQCMESLLQQTLAEIEYIFVNDASTDKSLAIIKTIASRYPQRNINIIDLEHNGGISNARNTGLKHATGEYVTHCDSDDWLETHAYEKLYHLAREQNADIVSCNFIHEYASRHQVCHQPYSPNNNENIRRMLNGQLFPSLWTSLIKRDVIVANKLQFPSGLNMGEDLLFNVKAYYFSMVCISTEEPLYHYRHSDNSVCVRRSRQSIDSDIAIARLIEEFLTEVGVETNFHTEVTFRKFFSKLALIRTFNHESDYESWLNIYPETHSKIWTFKQISFQLRFQLWLSAHHMYSLAKGIRILLNKQKHLRDRL